MLNFLGIGAQKAGTTWLMRMLKQHPQVMISHIGKEVHYFDVLAGTISRDYRTERAQLRLNKKLELYEKRANLKKDKIAHIKKLLEPEFMFTDAWYADLFEPRPDNVMAGEITPNYSALPMESIQHIKRLMPDVAVIYLIRDPYDRALSSLRMQRETDLRLEDVIKTVEFLSRGQYNQNIPRWDEVYGDQILYLPFGDIRTNPEVLMRKIENHIGLEPLETYNRLHAPVNSTQDRNALISEEIKKDLKTITEPQYAFLERRFGKEFFDRIK